MSAVQVALPLPPHYDPSQAERVDYHPSHLELGVAAAKWRRTHSIQAVSPGQPNIELLVIDGQLDFSFPTGSLYVGGHSGVGAIEDSRRIAEFIYRNLGLISRITPTMDTHLPYQVFYPSAHVRSDGVHPDPYTQISHADYASGVYQANPLMARALGADQAWLTRQFTDYCRRLEAGGRYGLTIWPYHCEIGEPGHGLVGVISAARIFHGYVRGAANDPAIKGGHPLTENYSVFQPEVLETWDGKPIGHKNVELLQRLSQSDLRLIICGQASSHCVAWTIRDFLGYLQKEAPEMVQRVYVVEDMMSPVVVKDPAGNVVADFAPQARAALDDFRNAGMHVVKSTDPIESWPGMRI